MKIPGIGTVEEDGHNSADESTTYQLIKACYCCCLVGLLQIVHQLSCKSGNNRATAWLVQ